MAPLKRLNGVGFGRLIVGGGDRAFVATRGRHRSAVGAVGRRRLALAREASSCHQVVVIFLRDRFAGTGSPQPFPSAPVLVFWEPGKLFPGKTVELGTFICPLAYGAGDISLVIVPEHNRAPMRPVTGTNNVVPQIRFTRPHVNFLATKPGFMDRIW